MVGEKLYTVRLMVRVGTVENGYIDRKAMERIVMVSANYIREDDEYITFFDKWDDVAGRFKKSCVISYAREVGNGRDT